MAGTVGMDVEEEVDDVETSSLSSTFLSSIVKSSVSLKDSRISKEDSDCGVRIFDPSGERFCGVRERSDATEVKEASILVSSRTFSRSLASCEDLVTSLWVRSPVGLVLSFVVALRSLWLSGRVCVSTEPTIRISSTTPLVWVPVGSFCRSYSEYSSLRNTGLLNSMLRSDTGMTSNGDFSSDVGLTRGFLRAWGFLRLGGGCGDVFLAEFCGVVSSSATRLLTNPAVVFGGDDFAVCGGEVLPAWW